MTRVRRRLGSLVAAVVCAALLAACGGTRAPGVDGNLTNGWPAMAEARTLVPDAGACYVSGYNPNWIGEFATRMADCTDFHKSETVWVGTFTGALAQRTTAPVKFSTELADTYRQCEVEAEKYLGGPWQSAWLNLGLTVPSDKAWHGGARWYRCDLISVTRDIYEEEVSVKTSAKDGLRGNHPVARGCLLVEDDSSGYLVKEDAIDCAQPHNAEYAGLYTLRGSYITDRTKRYQQESWACQVVFASFLGVSYGGSDYFGYLWHDISQDEWNLGVRTAMCAVLGFGGSDSPNKIRFTGSVKGTGNKKPTGWHK